MSAALGNNSPAPRVRQGLRIEYKVFARPYLQVRMVPYWMAACR